MTNSNLPPPSSRDEFEIAVICALAIEYDAVALLIDQFWDEDGDKYGRAIGDLNTYTTGRMRGFDIVLVLLPEIGKVSAASAASSFRSSFPNITLALLVGTCGGVPYTKDNEEILLGDVIISKTVIQYDLGGRHGEEFLTKETLGDILGRPGRNIRSILTVIETNHGRERLENRAAVLLEQLQRHASQKKMRKPVKYEYPGVVKDQLFKPKYAHKHQVLLPHRCCEEVPCDRSHTLSCADLGCEDEHLVQRQRLKDQAQHFSIFLGSFGSGDATLKSGMYRDQIAQRHGLLALEIEGAGIWDELPCVIVKGISNYADGHQNAVLSWQQFAAATAAATARALIERYPKTDKAHPPLAIIEKHRERTKEEDKCLRDMHITDPSLDKKRIEDTNGGLLKDSYIWILTNADFMQWRNNPDGGLLWIKGDPGKGKTMLLCGIIDELQADQATRPYYFFCQASNSRLNSATKVLCSLVYSIACQDQVALSYVMEKYKHAGKELFYNDNTWAALSQILTHILRNIDLKNKMFIIDALDECVIDLPLLLDFIAQTSGLFEVKWIVSSRNWPSIEERLNTISKKLRLSLELNERSVSDAVRVYIEHKVNQLAILKGLDAHSRDAIQTHLSNNANGTFLWVALVYKELFKWGVKKRHLRDLMTAFPPDLVPLYMRMMTQVCESQDADVCVQVLGLISLTYRPITLLELTSLVQIQIPESDDSIEELRDVIATCGSFLVLKNDVVYFVHQSAKDFLLNNVSNLIFSDGIARKHHNIFSRSVKILSQTLRQDMYDLRHPGALNCEDSAHNPDPLAPLRYSCLFWVDHLRDTGSYPSGKAISQHSLRDEGAVHSFLKVYLLYWFEAFSLMGRLSEGIMAIRTLESLTVQHTGLLYTFIRDASRFILSSRSAIERTPLQLYSSALIFTPASSIIRKTFEHIHSKPWITQKPTVRSEWDACLQILEGHRNRVMLVKYSPDGTKLASFSRDFTIRIWDWATGAFLQAVTFGLCNSYMEMEFSPDSSQLVIICGGLIKILDLNTGDYLMTLDCDSYFESVAFSPNGTQLLLSNKCWKDDKFQIWDLATKTRLRKEDYYQGIGEPAVCQLDTPNESKITKVRNPVTGSCVQIANEYRPSNVLFSSDGSKLVFGDCQDRKTCIYILDAATGKCLQRITKLDAIRALALSPDGTKLAVGTKAHRLSSNVEIWDTKTGACLWVFSGHLLRFIQSVAFSPDGAEVASSSEDTTIRIWDLALGASVHAEKEHELAHSATYSPDSTRLALIKRSTIQIFDSTTRTCLQQLELGGQPNMVVISPDNTRLAVTQDLVGNERELLVWDIAVNPPRPIFKATWYDELQARPRLPRRPRCCPPPSMVFSPNGTQVALAVRHSGTTNIDIWDVTNNTIIHTFHYGITIIGMRFSSDGRRLGSVSNGGFAQIWDLNTGGCLQTLKFDAGKIRFTVKCKYLRFAQFQCFIANMLQKADSIHSVIHEFDLSSDNKWLLRRGEPFLWLPLEYRPSAITFSGGHIAIITNTQRALLFRFCLAELDAEMASNRSSILQV